MFIEPIILLLNDPTSAHCGMMVDKCRNKQDFSSFFFFDFQIHFIYM